MYVLNHSVLLTSLLTIYPLSQQFIQDTSWQLNLRYFCLDLWAISLLGKNHWRWLAGERWGLANIRLIVRGAHIVSSIIFQNVLYIVKFAPRKCFIELCISITRSYGHNYSFYILGLQFKWNQVSWNSCRHTSCIHMGLHAGKWPDLMPPK